MDGKYHIFHILFLPEKKSKKAGNSMRENDGRVFKVLFYIYSPLASSLRGKGEDSHLSCVCSNPGI